MQIKILLKIDLSAETNESLVPIDVNKCELKLNHLYLIRHENKLRRASLIAMTGKQRTLLFHLIDYGTRAEVITSTSDSASCIYVLMPTKYFQHPPYAVHCRLQFADNFDKLLSKEERQKVARQVQLAQFIRVVVSVPSLVKTLHEPFAIEILDSAIKVVDSTLAQAASRFFNKNFFEIESQELIKGFQVVSLLNNIPNKFVKLLFYRKLIERNFKIIY